MPIWVNNFYDITLIIIL